MRLICPNCGAQYQIDTDVIPDGGRDVQCSNCGHTWFERPGASEAAEEGFGAMETLAEPKEDFATPAQDAAPAAPEAPAPTASDDDYHEDVDTDTDDIPAAFKRKPLDTSVADILQQEAERETAARMAEKPAAPVVETPQDLPVDPPKVTAPVAPPVIRKPVIEIPDTPTLDVDIPTPDIDVPEVPDETLSRIARLRSDEANIAAVAAVTAASSRKEMLPDIEEINSTLRSSAERGETPAPMPEQVEKTKKRGFRFGFLLGLLLIVLLILLYIFADQIIAAVPALDGAISGYVGMVDSFRIWIDGLIRGAADSMEPAADASN